MTRRRFPQQKKGKKDQENDEKVPPQKKGEKDQENDEKVPQPKKGKRRTTNDNGEKVPQPKKKGKKEQTVSGDEDNDTPGKKTFAGRREPPVVESRAYHMYCSMRDAFNIIIKPTIQKSSKWQEQFELFGIN